MAEVQLNINTSTREITTDLDLALERSTVNQLLGDYKSHLVILTESNVRPINVKHPHHETVKGMFIRSL